MYLTASCLFAALLGEKDGVDVRKDTSGGDGDSSQKAVEFLVVLYCKSNVTGDDTALLVVAGGVSGKFQDLGTEVLEDGSQVNGGTSSHSGGVLSLTQVTSDTTNRELQTGLSGCGCGFLLSATSFSFSCNYNRYEVNLLEDIFQSVEWDYTPHKRIRYHHGYDLNLPDMID